MWEMNELGLETWRLENGRSDGRFVSEPSGVEDLGNSHGDAPRARVAASVPCYSNCNVIMSGTLVIARVGQ